MRRWFSICSLLLALLWAPATSHCLLEHAGWIHHPESCAQHDASADHDHNYGHDAADGACHTAGNAAELAKRPDAAPDWLTWSAVALLTAALEAPALEPRPVRTEAVAEFSPRWQFVLRTALPARAPSC